MGGRKSALLALLRCICVERLGRALKAKDGSTTATTVVCSRGVDSLARLVCAVGRAGECVGFVFAAVVCDFVSGALRCALCCVGVETLLGEAEQTCHRTRRKAYSTVVVCILRCLCFTAAFFGRFFFLCVSMWMPRASSSPPPFRIILAGRALHLVVSAQHCVEDAGSCSILPWGGGRLFTSSHRGWATFFLYRYLCIA